MLIKKYFTLPTYPSVFLPVCLSVWLWLCLYLCLCLYICLFLSVCLCLSLYVCLFVSVCLSVCLTSLSLSIDFVSKKVSNAVGGLKRVRPCVPIKTLETIYKSLIQPHFDYYDIVWSNLNVSQSLRLQKLQKELLE